MGDVLNSSISHAMLIKDSGHLGSALSDVGQMENIEGVQIIGVNGAVWSADSHQVEKLGSVDLSAEECWVCHQLPPGERPRAVDLNTAGNIIRISSPIANQPECFGCHETTNANLGILLIDISLQDIQTNLLNDLRLGLLISIIVTAMITVGIYWSVSRLVVRRIEAFRQPMAAYAAGDHSARIPVSDRFDDEISQLAGTFNHMTDEIDRYNQEREKRRGLRQRAIAAERERIARELHDGIAQVLGYVNTKASAVRLNLQKERIRAASQQLSQLEEAARGAFVDVREAILGLRITGREEMELVPALENYVEQFNRMGDVPLRLRVASPLENELAPQVVLHLLRIVQEAVTNARKHACATMVDIRVDLDNGNLVLTVEDDGVGFNPQSPDIAKDSKFGLETMQGRAEEIGAVFQIRSQPGAGTCVVVELPLWHDGS
jgi:signal transduction histidine kinase